MLGHTPKKRLRAALIEACWPLPAAFTLVVLAAGAHAQEVSKTETALKEVVVTATRTETEADAVPATVTRITRERIDRRLPADEADLFKDEPDVAFGRDLRRFGATRPNIRGIEDNRVVQFVDGIRLPDFYNGGGPTNFTMNAPLGTPLEFLKRVEILRGPASSLYGSDAIGGVVGYLTLDPGDLLERDRRFGARARAGYASANEALTGTLLGAVRGDGLEWLFGYAETRASELDNRGDVDTVSAARTRPNPQDVRDRGAIAKAIWSPAGGHTVRFTAEGRDQDVDVEALRLSATLPKVTAMAGDDHTRRARGSVEWEHSRKDGWYDRLITRLHHQKTDTENFNRQTRSNTSASCSAAAGSGNTCLVEQDFVFEQRATGGGVQIEKAIGSNHFLTAGADLTRVRTEELRDARIRNLTTGTTSRSLAGDTFPLRDFPIGQTDTVGIFVQDEVALAEGGLSIVPGLRYDRRRLEAEVDDLSQAVLSAIGRQAVSQTDDAVSPKLAALWRLSPRLTAYGQVVRGFRAPNYEEVNGAFRNSIQSYGISPNPDLEPEKSTGLEIGLRLTGAPFRGQIALFDNRYRDFIENVRLTCPGDPNCISGLSTTFMFVNVSKVRISGAEARLAWDFAPGWQLDGVIAHARGTKEKTDLPLDSVEPTRMSAGLVRDAGEWGAEARVRGAARKSRVDDSGGVWFRPPGYGVVDLAAWWRPAKGLRLAVAVNNVLDRKYWLWSDIRLADARNPVGVDFYSQPGRNASARLEYVF